MFFVTAVLVSIPILYSLLRSATPKSYRLVPCLLFSCFLLSVSGRSRGNSGTRDALKDIRAPSISFNPYFMDPFTLFSILYFFLMMHKLYLNTIALPISLQIDTIANINHSS